MSHRMALVALYVAILVPCLSVAGWGQGSRTPQGASGGQPLAALGPAQKRGIERNLGDPRWDVRAGAVQQLQSVAASAIGPEMRRMLIALLRQETLRLEDRLKGTNPEAYPPKEAGEAWGEYYAGLLGLVLEFHDPASLPVLVSAAWQPSDVDSQLARYGPPLIPIVVSRLSYLQQFHVRLSGHSDLVARIAQTAMADILTDMMSLDREKKLKTPLSPSDYTEIRRALRPLLDSANNYVRLYAAIALAKASDDQNASRIKQVFEGFFAASIPGERSIALDKILASVSAARFVPLGKVEELARSDPYHYLKSTPSGKETVYPVRQRALQVLAKFNITNKGR